MLWWQDRYGHAAGGVPPVMQMPLADAIALLGVPVDYTKDDVIAAFHREAKKAHPDAGGTPELFRQLVEARDRLLAALGTSAPAWVVRGTFRFAYANALINRSLYPLQKLTKHKGAFAGTAVQSYYAYNRHPSLPRLIKVLRACTLI